ncbi:MAG: Calx-beta domain-containing protein, partial [Pontimonas sp.]
LTVPPNQTSKTFTVTSSPDLVFEGPESVVASITDASTNGQQLTATTPSASALIVDDGSLIDPNSPNGPRYDSDRPTVSISATDNLAVEGSGNNTLAFAVTQSAPSDFPTDIVVTLDLGTVEPDDLDSVVTYNDPNGIPAQTTVAALRNGLELTIPASSSNPWSPEFTLTVANDNIQEAIETLSMSVALATTESDASLGNASDSASIKDQGRRDTPDDGLGDLPTISIAPSSTGSNIAIEAADAGETGALATPALFTVSLSNPSDFATTLTLALTPGAANAAELGSGLGVGADISSFQFQSGIDTNNNNSPIWSNVPNDGQLTLDPGVTTLNLRVNPASDLVYESTENFNVVISSAAIDGQSLATTANASKTAAGVIADDLTTGGSTSNPLGDLPSVSIARDLAAVSEGDSGNGNTITYTVNLSTTSEYSTKVYINLGGTAEPDDYTAAGLTAETINNVTRYFLTVPANQTSQTFSITSSPDLVFEGPESVVASITEATTNGQQLTATTPSASALIVDDGSLLDDGGTPNDPSDDRFYDSDRPTVSISATDNLAV